MYGAATQALFESLPELPGLSGAFARETLSAVYLEIVAKRLDTESSGITDSDQAPTRTLRRLASALESFAIFDDLNAVDAATRDGGAFVAAEALGLASDLHAREPRTTWPYRLADPRYLTLAEAGLLYLTAGFDANATPCARMIPARAGDPRSPEARWAEWACDLVRDMLFLRPARERDSPRVIGEAEVLDDLSGSARAALFRELGQIIEAYLKWLGGGAGEPAQLAERARHAATLLEEARAAEHSDIHHLLRLLDVVIQRTASRALRSVPSPGQAHEPTFRRYLERRAKGGGGQWPRPLIWPPALVFAAEYLGGVARHAVISAPTGSGKSGIAELALSHALATGWAVYLVPTNALANQVRADLSEGLRGHDVQVRSFVGDAEYSLLRDESVTAADANAGTIVVMTPEKCALALRLRPDLLSTCQLCVFDECHLLGDGPRGALAELVISHMLALTGDCRFVLMSALIANPRELADWLERSTGGTTLVVQDPWRPTRTMRAAVGVDQARGQAAALAAFDELQGRPANVHRQPFAAPHALLANLHGPWATSEPDDYGILHLPTTTRLRITRERQVDRAGWMNGTAAALTGHLARHGFSVLTFTASSPHHAFSIANDLDLGEVRREEPSPRTRAYLALAADELGVPSQLSDAIARGVAVHTGALIDPERLASERSFRESSPVAMVATGTLAQGLNLPATAVVVAGTNVGDPRDLQTEDGRARAQAQLLNAIGRSGRAGVSNQGLSIVVPNRPVQIGSTADAEAAREAIPFLSRDDDSTRVTSRLSPLIDQATADVLDVSAATPDELVAYSYLPADTPAGVSAADILLNSLALSSRPDGTAAVAADVANRVLEAGSAYLEATTAPQWLTGASYRTGFPFFTALRFAQARSRALDVRSDVPPETIGDWLDHLFAVLRLLTPNRTAEVLGKPINAEPIRLLWETTSDDPTWTPSEDWLAAWDRVHRATTAYLDGAQLSALATELLEVDEPVDPQRTGGAQPIPRIIGFANGTIERLSRLAGLLVACEELDPHLLRDDEPRDSSNSNWLSLAVLPLAVRCGCGDMSSLAWFRFALRQRRVSHVFGRALPLPAEYFSDVPAREWVGTRLAMWLSDDLDVTVAETEAELLSAARLILT